MAKPRSSAHAELDQLRQTVARERLRARDVDAELEAAKQRVEDISDDLTEAFAAEDQQAAQRTRKQLQAAEAKAVALQTRSRVPSYGHSVLLASSMRSPPSTPAISSKNANLLLANWRLS